MSIKYEIPYTKIENFNTLLSRKKRYIIHREIPVFKIYRSVVKEITFKTSRRGLSIYK
ncbi:hypothetical protein GCM10023315_11800 [Algibacter aquimarinus]|uniref:Uncharacterized protein n=1 Tax=Algibacter aquimarinus TaxID=1136748 RepID=A0ABP9H9A0_9FLAO